MKNKLAILSLIVSVSLTVEAFGHGNPLHVNVNDGHVTVARGLSLTEGFVRLASDPHEDAAFDFAPNQKLRSVYPGYDVEGLASDASLQFEIIPRPDFSSEGHPLRWLWYWSSTSQSVEPVPNNATFSTIPLFGSGLVQATQSSLASGPTLTMANPVGPFLGADQHLLVYELQNYSPSGTGAYGIFAQLTSTGLEPSEPFLLLFRYGAVPEDFELAAQAINLAAVLPGDFNHNDVVDAADYTVWRDGLGGAYAAQDYDVWKSHFGQASSGGGAAAGIPAPEPAAWMLAIGGATLLLGHGLSRSLRIGKRHFVPAFRP